MKVDEDSVLFGHTWEVNDDELRVTNGGETRLVTDSYLFFPGTTSALEEEEIDASAGSEQMANTILGKEGAWSVVYYNEVERSWRSMPFSLNITHLDMKKDLLSVSRKTQAYSSDDFYSDKLFELVTSATRRLLEKNWATKEKQTHVGVCLSGGVDSSFVAHAVHCVASPDVVIDLVNVAFGETEQDCAKAPDRARALAALSSLRRRYPDREFRLILANICQAELVENRNRSIAQATLPANSVLDDSLACVLWFSLRGHGTDFDNGDACVSPANILFVGSGADEIFAGYARHRTRFERDRLDESVAEECEAELRRLGHRNGGRDARVAAQLHKTLLSPLLEDSVVRWANNIPTSAKWDLSLPRGVGEKKIIRNALRNLGSPYDAPKQAMQFGSRMAKLNNAHNKVKGSDLSPNLAVEVEEN